MYPFFKRGADIIFSILGIILSSPLLLLFILLLLISGERKPIFISYRVGKNGNLFRIFKLRSMRSSGGLKNSLTSYRDSRVTFLGRLLRFSKIDELPQFFNILNGDLSFVGPRPLLPEIFYLYPKKTQDVLNQITPGVTGIGSIVFRNESVLFSKIGKRKSQDFYKDSIAPVKGRLELWYYNNKGFKTDLKLLILTVVAVLYGQVKGLHRHFKGLPSTDVLGAD